jgi:phage gpG-like protein
VPIKFKTLGLGEAISGNKKLRAQIDKVVVHGVKRTTIEGTAEIRRLASGPILKARSGRYRASVRHEFADKGKTGRTGPNVEYAAQKEHGGVITPKKGQYLTIPLRGAQTRSGVARRPITEYEGFFHRTSDGRLFFFGSPTEGSDRVVPLFFLTKRVKQEPKHLVRKSRENIAPEAGDRLRREIRKTISEVIGR